MPENENNGGNADKLRRKFIEVIGKSSVVTLFFSVLGYDYYKRREAQQRQRQRFTDAHGLPYDQDLLGRIIFTRHNERLVMSPARNVEIVEKQLFNLVVINDSERTPVADMEASYFSLDPDGWGDYGAFLYFSNLANKINQIKLKVISPDSVQSSVELPVENAGVDVPVMILPTFIAAYPEYNPSELESCDYMNVLTYEVNPREVVFRPFSQGRTGPKFLLRITTVFNGTEVVHDITLGIPRFEGE